EDGCIEDTQILTDGWCRYQVMGGSCQVDGGKLVGIIGSGTTVGGQRFTIGSNGFRYSGAGSSVATFQTIDLFNMYFNGSQSNMPVFYDYSPTQHQFNDYGNQWLSGGGIGSGPTNGFPKCHVGGPGLMFLAQWNFFGGKPAPKAATWNSPFFQTGGAGTGLVTGQTIKCIGTIVLQNSGTLTNANMVTNTTFTGQITRAANGNNAATVTAYVLGLPTAGNESGSPIFVGFNNRHGLTTDDGSPVLLYISTTSTTELHWVAIHLFVTAYTSGTVTYTLAWTENGVSKTRAITGAALNAFSEDEVLICPDASTNVTIQRTGGATATVTAAAIIQRYV